MHNNPVVNPKSNDSSISHVCQTQINQQINYIYVGLSQLCIKIKINHAYETIQLIIAKCSIMHNNPVDNAI